MNTTDITIEEAMSNPALFGSILGGPTWQHRWLAVLKAAYGEDLTASQLESFCEVAGGRKPPQHRVSELCCCIGRGGGKTATAAFLAAHAAMSFNPATARLIPGENVFVLTLAVDKEQAAICFNMCKGFFETIPTLMAMVKHVGSDSITLRNRVTIKITTNDYKSVRGRGVLVCIMDECAFWATAENTSSGAPASNPDIEVYAAISPGLARVKNSMLIMISSVYRRQGMLFDSWLRNYGKNNDDTLCVLGTTTQFNPLFSQKIIDRELLIDRPRAAAEYNSVFRDDNENNLIDRAAVESCLDRGIFERPPMRGVTYFAFGDVATGAKLNQDSMTLAIAHMENECVVIDCLREAIPPFGFEGVCKEFAQLCSSYNVSVIQCDKFGAGMFAEQLAKWGVRADYEKTKPKAELYFVMITKINSRLVRLLDHDTAFKQIMGLVRRNHAGGRGQIDSVVGAHDDVSNSIAGAIMFATSAPLYNLAAMGDHDNSSSIMAARQDRAEGSRSAPIGPRLEFKSQAEFNRYQQVEKMRMQGFKLDADGVRVPIPDDEASNVFTARCERKLGDYNW
jgi:hypothetical protein